MGLQKLGVPEEQLPPAFQEGSVVQRVYICKGCFSEVEKFIKLQADVESSAGSIRIKLRAKGLSIADSGPSISGQVATESRSVSGTCKNLDSTHTHVYANMLYQDCIRICLHTYTYLCIQDMCHCGIMYY